MLLTDWLTSWLDLYKTDVRENTRRMYLVAIHAVIKALPPMELERMELPQLLQIRRWQIRRAQAQPRAAQIENTMICQALRKAQALGLMGRGVDVREALPKIKHTAAETAIFTEQELIRYCAAVLDSGEPFGIPLLLCCCGLRRGEALGARWQDWNRPILSINGAVSRGTYGPPKSRAGCRSLILPEGLADLIDQQPHTLRNPYICPCTEKQIRDAHKRVMEWAELEGVTLHGLRHSFATMAASKGVSMKLLQIGLGHSKIGLTADLYAGHPGYDASPLPAQVLGWLAS